MLKFRITFVLLFFLSCLDTDVPAGEGIKRLPGAGAIITHQIQEGMCVIVC